MYSEVYFSNDKKICFSPKYTSEMTFGWEKKLKSLMSHIFLHVLGPLAFNEADYTGGLPQLILRPYPWTKVNTIISLISHSPCLL